jgi:hypothetical protein
MISVIYYTSTSFPVFILLYMMREDKMPMWWDKVNDIYVVTWPLQNDYQTQVLVYSRSQSNTKLTTKWLMGGWHIQLGYTGKGFFIPLLEHIRMTLDFTMLCKTVSNL